jgi:hypothetical protein
MILMAMLMCERGIEKCEKTRYDEARALQVHWRASQHFHRDVPGNYTSG